MKTLTKNARTIVVLGTLDTKGREIKFVKEIIERIGFRALVVDVGVIGEPLFKPDISREEVAEAGGMNFRELLENPSREVASPLMSRGASKLIEDMVKEGMVHGIISMGGTQGTSLATAVMRSLPIGFPKLMVSTVASGNTAPFVDIYDITMMHSVADILGLNPVTKKILSNAAHAICGMASSEEDLEVTEKPLVAVTTVGITTPCAMKAIELLEAHGCETIVFHAVGTGGRAMEHLMKQGTIKAVLDIATIEVTNDMYGGLLAGGGERLTVAGRLGIPQVLAPGAIAILVFGRPETIPEKYRDRKIIRHSPLITDIRITREEQVKVAEEMAARLRHTRDPAVFMIPRRGFDSYSAEGGPFWEPESDRAFVEALKASLPANIEVVELNYDINDPRFAEEMVKALLALMLEKGLLKRS
ncbi:MAG: Tm-1-like ATP-binding domain-containing protein [Candidatus Bathyarchaeia archaeon]